MSELDPNNLPFATDPEVIEPLEEVKEPEPVEEFKIPITEEKVVERIVDVQVIEVKPTLSPAQKENLKAILKNSGADSMSQIKAFDQIVELLEK